MFFLCACCLIGVIIYACCNNTLHNGYRNNIGELANAPMIKQLDNLQGTANYSQEFGPVIYYAMIIIINMTESIVLNIGMLAMVGGRTY